MQDVLLQKCLLLHLGLCLVTDGQSMSMHRSMLLSAVSNLSTQGGRPTGMSMAGHVLQSWEASYPLQPSLLPVCLTSVGEAAR